MLLDDLRRACAEVAGRAGSVRINRERLPDYARTLAPAVAAQLAAPPDPEAELLAGSTEDRAAFWLCLDAINFGSGWFPTLRRRSGRSGYFTVAIGLRERFSRDGRFTADELLAVTPAEVAAMLGQASDHPLMALFAESLRDVGRHVAVRHHSSFAAAVDAAAGSAAALVSELATWAAFADTSPYGRLRVPFLKRAQIAAADLHRSGTASFADIDRLTVFADNLLPHVLHEDGLLGYAPDLARRIERGELLTHGSAEEVELRACAVHAGELLVGLLPGVTATQLDLTLWNRGQAARYREAPRPRCRCTAY